MPRPTIPSIDADLEGWDAPINDFAGIVRDKPLPVALHGGTEANLEATFPAAQYTQCLINVNHSSLGWTLYYSTGTVWKKVTVT
jgi:hypothetical protein